MESTKTGLYRKTKVRVSTMTGELLAWTYVLDAFEGGLPSASYLGVMAEAAEAADAPDDYVAGLRLAPAARPASDRPRGCSQRTTRLVDRLDREGLRAGVATDRSTAEVR